MSSNEPVKNGCEVIYEMFHINSRLCRLNHNRKNVQKFHFKVICVVDSR